MSETETLFPDLDMPPVEQPEKLSADRRRTQRQRDAVARGVHPLTGSPLADEPEAKCGNCRFRELFDHHNKSYPKCTYGDGLVRVTHSASSDVRAWWPGCSQHEWGDTGLSPDAMRSGPAS